MSNLWQFITDFGDASVTLPIATFVLIYLLWNKRWQVAFAWGLAVTGCGVSLVLIKLALRSCAQNWANSQFVSASGHAAMSATIYGGFILLFGAARRPSLVALVFAMVAAIALSRVILGVHRPLEVVAGLAIGTAAILLLDQARGSDRRPSPMLFPFGGVLAVAVLMHGDHWPIEDYLVQLAGLIRHAVPACS